MQSVEWTDHHCRLYELTSKSWSVANQVDSDEVRDRIRLAFAGIERIGADPALEDDRLGEVWRHLDAASERATTDDVRVPVRNAQQHLHAIQNRPEFATDGGGRGDD